MTVFLQWNAEERTVKFYMNERIRLNYFESLKLIQLSLHSRETVAYDYYLTDDVRFSILTGSHFDSAKLGTVEVALMYKEHFIFGDDDHQPEEDVEFIFGKSKDSDASIISYLDYEDFATMMAMFDMLNKKKPMSIGEIGSLFLCFYHRSYNN